MSGPPFSNPGIGPPDDPPPGGDGSASAGLGELRGTVSEVLRVVSVRRWMFFVPFCAVATAAFVLSLYVPRRYTSSTKFERRDDPVLVNLPSAGGMGTFELYRGTLTKDIKGVEALTQVVRNLGLADKESGGGQEVDTDPEAREARIRALATRISSRLQVLFHKRSTHLDVIEILYTGPTPNGIAVLLDEIRDSYIRRTRERFTAKLRQTREWFDNEYRKRREIVTALEHDLDVYRSEHLGIDPLDLNDSLIHLATLRSEVGRLERRKNEFTTRLDGRRGLLASHPQTPVDAFAANQGVSLEIQPVRRSEAAIRLADELRASRAKIEELSVDRGMTERHPTMIALRREERQLADALEEQQARDARSVSVNGVAQLAGLSAPGGAEDAWASARAQIENDVRIFEQLVADSTLELEAAKARVAEYEAERRVALSHYRMFRNREADAARADNEAKLYQGYGDQITRVLSAEGAKRGVKFEKIKPASTSSLPASPRMTTIVIFSILAGVAAGVVLVLLSELFDRTVRARTQVVRGLGLPILESIDEIVSAVARRRRFLRRVILVPAVTTTFTLLVLLSGTLAYVSLHNRPLYERLMRGPRSAFDRVAHVEDPARTVTLARVDGEEHPG